MTQTDTDVLIIGGGPGGTSAACYLTRPRISFLQLPEVSRAAVEPAAVK